MTVTAKLYLGLREFLPDGAGHSPLRLDMREGATVSELLNILRIPPDTPTVVVVSGRIVGGNHVLKEGDTVHIFPPLLGG